MTYKYHMQVEEMMNGGRDAKSDEEKQLASAGSQRGSRRVSTASTKSNATALVSTSTEEKAEA